MDVVPSEGRKAACETYVEQAKLLTTLASAFVVAPAVVKDLQKIEVTWALVTAELLFVLSLVAGYLTIGSVTGSQHEGTFDVKRAATMWTGRIQFGAYLFGVALLGIWFFSAASA